MLPKKMGVPRQLWAVSFNPGHGVSDEQVKKLADWAKKFPKHIVITEGQDERRHCHAAIMRNKLCAQGNVITEIQRLFPDLPHPRVAIVVKHWYNWDWYDNYMDKGDATVVILNNIDRDVDLLPFAAKDDKQDVRPVSAWYNKMEKWLKQDERFPEPYTEEKVLAFLNTKMNVDREIEVIADPKSLQQKTRALLRYVIRYDGDTYPNKRYKTEHQEDVDFASKYLPNAPPEEPTVLYKAPPAGFPTME